MKDRGKIIKIDKKNITVEVAPRQECHKCGACHGSKKQQMIIPLMSEYQSMEPGDAVDLIIDDSIMLKISLLMYGAPLFVFITAILTAYYLTKHPLISFSAAFIATIFSYLFLGRYSRKNRSFVPEIKKTADK